MLSISNSPGGYAGHNLVIFNIFCHNGSRTNYRTISNAYTCINDRMRTNP